MIQDDVLKTVKDVADKYNVKSKDKILEMDENDQIVRNACELPDINDPLNKKLPLGIL